MKPFLSQIQKHGERTALIFNEKPISFDRLVYEVSKIDSSHFIQNETIVILGDFNPIAIFWFFALYNNNNTIVPITSSNQQEIDKKIEIVRPKYVVHSNSNQILETSYEQDAERNNLYAMNNSSLVLFSSGSTGEPKAMVHNLDNLVDQYPTKKAKNLNLMVLLLFDHIGGLNTMFNSLSMGSSLTLPTNKSPEDIAHLIEKNSINILPASPTFLNLMLMADCTEKYDLSSLRMITYGTETMPQSLLLRLKKAFPKVKFLQTFGTSETGIIKTSSQSSESLFMKLDDENQEYKIVDGELWLKSKTQILGYLNSDMKSFEDGWFKTGDLVEEIENGYLKIVGRIKEVINVGGEKVLPSEVESVILSSNLVDDCMVYGKSNVITGQMVCADVVPKKESDDLKKQLKLFCKQHLDAYKVPAKIKIVEQTNFSERYKKMRL